MDIPDVKVTAGGDRRLAPIRHAASNSGSPSITVVCRKRPLIPSECRRGEFDVIRVSDRHSGRLKVDEEKRDITGAAYSQPAHFEFDRVYCASHNTRVVYEDSIRPIVHNFLTTGGKNSVFTYGQTASGKTYSLLGCPKALAGFDGATSPDPEGLLHMAVSETFENIRLEANRSWVRLSCYEIYLNKCYDLLNDRRQLRSLETASGDVAVHGIQFEYCDDVYELLQTVTTALKTRITGSNAKNQTSSRGHFVCQLEVVNSLPQDAPIVERPTGRSSLRAGTRLIVSASAQSGVDRASIHPNSRCGKLAFIDLAGTERAADSAFSETLRSGTNGDGANINKSLLALKECIRAIDAGSTHVPFRDSILTKVLREYLVPADARTVMLVHVSPSSGSVESSMNALHYASLVWGLRKRCRPLLMCTPPAPPADEVFTDDEPLTVVPKPSRASLPVRRQREGRTTARTREVSPIHGRASVGATVQSSRDTRRLSAPGWTNKPTRLEDLLPTPPRGRSAEGCSRDRKSFKTSMNVKERRSDIRTPVDILTYKEQLSSIEENVNVLRDGGATQVLMDEKIRCCVVLGELLFSKTIIDEAQDVRSQLVRRAMRIEGELSHMILEAVNEMEWMEEQSMGDF